MKKTAAVLLAAALTLAALPAAVWADGRVVAAKAHYRNIQVRLDGQPATLTNLEGRPQEPLILFDTVYVPLSATARAFGMSSEWSRTDKAIRLKTGAAASVDNQPTLGHTEDKAAQVYYYGIRVYINGQEAAITNLEGQAQEPVILFDTCYVPLSAFARALGGSSEWDQANYTVKLATKGGAAAGGGSSSFGISAGNTGKNFKGYGEADDVADFGAIVGSAIFVKEIDGGLVVYTYPEAGLILAMAVGGLSFENISADVLMWAAAMVQKGWTPDPVARAYGILAFDKGERVALLTVDDDAVYVAFDAK